MKRSVYRQVAVLAAILALLAPTVALAEGGPYGGSSATAPAMPATRPMPEGQGAPAVKVTREQAIDLVKRHFPLPEGPGELEATLDARGGRAVWQLQYTIREGNGSRGYGLGSVDAMTGRILNMNLLGPELRPLRFGPMKARPEPEARDRAWAAVRALFPEEAVFLEPAPAELAGAFGYRYGPFMPADLYHFTWVVYREGIPFKGSMVRVSVDRETLDLVSLESAFLNDVAFTSGPAKLTEEEALTRFRENLKPRLVYMAPGMLKQQPPSAGEAKLYWRLELSGGLLDAVSGKLVDYAGRETVPAAASEPLPPSSVTPVMPDQLPLDEESAVAWAKALHLAPDGAQIRSEPEFLGDGEAIRVHWFSPEASGGVTLDRRTGRIRDAYRSQPRRAPAAVVPAPPATAPSQVPAPPAPPVAQPNPAADEKAKQAAIDLVYRYFGHLAEKLRLEPRTEPVGLPSQPTLAFYFQRYENGVTVGYDGVRVNLDAETLEWTNLSATWTDGLTFPDPSQAISAEKAVDAFMAGRKALLAYELKASLPGAPYYPAAEQSGPKETMLVYRLVKPGAPPEFGLIDAFTAEEVQPGATIPPDQVDRLVAGHWAEGELRTVLARGGLRPEQLSPGATLTRGDALQLLLGSNRVWYGSGPRGTNPYTDVQAGSPLFSLVMHAYRSGILRPEGEKPVFDGDKPVTRAEFAVWVARQLSLGGLARSGLKVQTGFTDLAGLSQEERNAVAFLEALGLVKSGPVFRGSDAITQAEAAAIVVRMMQHSRSAR